MMNDGQYISENFICGEANVHVSIHLYLIVHDQIEERNRKKDDPSDRNTVLGFYFPHGLSKGL